MARRIINRRFRRVRYHDREDLVQAGCIGLLLAARAFDPLRGVEFVAYAANRVLNAAYDQLRAELGRHGERKLPLDLEPLSNLDPRLATHSFHVEFHLPKVRSLVLQRLRRVHGRRAATLAVRRWVDGERCDAIAESLGVTPPRVTQLTKPLEDFALESIAWAANQVAG